jgi:hypothetical protein
MKILFLSIVLVILTASCSSQGKQAVYDMIHERERQLCIEQGRSDCQRAESYEKYKKERDEIITPKNTAEPK